MKTRCLRPREWLALSCMVGLLLYTADASLRQYSTARASADQPHRDNKLEQLAVPKDDDGISGYYAVDGVMSGKDGIGTTPYEGVVVIDRIKAIYVFEWHVGDLSYTGCGIRRGKQLVVGWSYKSGLKIVRGVTWFDLYGGTEGQLRGRWTAIPGDGKVYTENLTLLRVRRPAVAPLPMLPPED